jgi:hypothetical protein
MNSFFDKIDFRSCQSGGIVPKKVCMKISKELEALVVSTLANMPADQFRRTLKAALDGRRSPDPMQAKPKAKKKLKQKHSSGPKKKMHWKTRQRLEREAAEKGKSK